MKLIKFLFILLPFLSFKINSNNLVTDVNEFFQQSCPFDNINALKTNAPFKKKQILKQPYFLLLNNLNNFCIFDILYIFKQQHKLFEIAVQVNGKYVITKKKILRGKKIKESDLKIVTGRLDKLPNGAYLRKEDIIGRVNLRDIRPFQPITSFMTRGFWIIKTNQEVTVKFKGMHFEIITTGKALGNGTFQEKIRVQIQNNKIITGIINQNKEVIVIV